MYARTTAAPTQFDAMVQGAVRLNLGQLLKEETFSKKFANRLETEHSAENLAFWRAVQEYQGLPSGKERWTRANALYDEYIVDGAINQINVSSGVASELSNQLNGGSEDDAPADMFDRAAAEVYKLMESDTFSRFRKDPDALKTLLGSYHEAAGAGAERVTFKAFKAWALREPTVLVFFTGLCTTIRTLLANRAKDGGFAEEEQAAVPRDEWLLNSANTQTKKGGASWLSKLGIRTPTKPKASPTAAQLFSSSSAAKTPVRQTV